MLRTHRHASEHRLELPFAKYRSATIFEAQVATDLSTWSALGSAYVSGAHNADGTETVTYRSTTPLASIPREFIRLRVNSR